MAGEVLTVFLALLAVAGANDCAYISTDVSTPRCLVPVEVSSPHVILGKETVFGNFRDLESVDEDQHLLTHNRRHHAKAHKYVHKTQQYNLEEVPELDVKSVKFKTTPWRGQFEPIKAYMGDFYHSEGNVKVILLGGPKPLIEIELRKIEFLKSLTISGSVSCAKYFPQLYGTLEKDGQFYLVMEWGEGDLANTYKSFQDKHMKSYQHIVTPEYQSTTGMWCDSSEFTVDKAAQVDFFGAHIQQLIGLEALTQMTTAVACVHQAGLVLNDIKLDKFVVRGDNSLFLYNTRSIGMGSLGDSSQVRAVVLSEYNKIKFSSDMTALHSVFVALETQVTKGKWKWEAVEEIKSNLSPSADHLLKRIELAYLKIFEHGLIVLSAKQQNYDDKVLVSPSPYLNDCLTHLTAIRTHMFKKMTEYSERYNRQLVPGLRSIAFIEDVETRVEVPRMDEMIELLAKTYLE